MPWRKFSPRERKLELRGRHHLPLPEHLQGNIGLLLRAEPGGVDSEPIQHCLNQASPVFFGADSMSWLCRLQAVAPDTTNRHPD